MATLESCILELEVEVEVEKQRVPSDVFVTQMANKLLVRVTLG